MDHPDRRPQRTAGSRQAHPPFSGILPGRREVDGRQRLRQRRGEPQPALEDVPRACASLEQSRSAGATYQKKTT